MTCNTDGITLSVLKPVDVNVINNLSASNLVFESDEQFTGPLISLSTPSPLTVSHSCERSGSSSSPLSGFETLSESSDSSPQQSCVLPRESQKTRTLLITSNNDLLPVKSNFIKNLLEKDTEGQAILEYFSKNNELTDALRSLLCRRIVILCLAQSPSKKISVKEIELISKAIEALFHPKEISETYYLPPVKENGKAIGASGKLYYTYTYLRRKLVGQEKENQNLSTNGNTDNDDFVMSEIAEIEEYINWLKTNLGDEGKLKDYWEKTRSKRKQILCDINSIFSYLHMFPCLRTSIAKNLLQSDFTTQYPDINFEQKWNDVKPKLINLFKKEIKPATSDLVCKLIDLEARGENADAILFLLLPYLFKRGPLKRDVKGKVKERCSLAEIRDAFIVHIENSCDLKAVINERRENLRKKQLQLQPTPVFVGKLETAITSAYVILDTEKYCFESASAAVHFAFVLFFTLGAKYPEEAKLIWQLIQVVVYGIRVKSSDLRSVEFSTLVGKLT